MKTITEYSPATSSHEVLAHLYDRILAGELPSFNDLTAYTDRVPELATRMPEVILKSFELQKRLYWGFFSGITPEAYPKVWKAVVMPDKKFPAAGTLKRMMSLQDIYMGLIDIHGYTRFCKENKRNLSMLALLDRMIQDDVSRLAAGSGVVSRRSRGDEILLLGAAAADVMEAILVIMEYFGGGKRLDDSTLTRSQAKGPLPTFCLSAGIAGGQQYTPLVITKDGDLSGDIVNTAARLQARADKIAPASNKILMTGQVYQKLKDPAVRRSSDRFAGIDFFDAGRVEFKGTSLGVYDTVFVDREKGRLTYRDEMAALYESLDQNAWKSKIFEDAMLLAEKLVKSYMALRVTGEAEKAGRAVDRNGLLLVIRKARDAFAADRFEAALEHFTRLVDDLAVVYQMDELALEYLAAVLENYTTIMAAFTGELDDEVEGHLDSIYLPKEQKTYALLKEHHELFERVAAAARLKVRNRKAIWFRVADEVGPALEVSVVSRK